MASSEKVTSRPFAPSLMGRGLSPAAICSDTWQKKDLSIMLKRPGLLPPLIATKLTEILAQCENASGKG